MPEGDDLVLAIDQGTSSTKALVVDRAGEVVARAQAPLAISHPQPGWAQQSLEDIWISVQKAVTDCLSKVPGRHVAAVGLSTQRESVALWDRRSGQPLGPMIGWQDRRTAEDCRRLLPAAGEPVRQLSGLPLDPMFSASKAGWLLREYDPGLRRSSRGELCLGTVDAWLLNRLTGVHQVEAGNASRTQLLDVRTGEWSHDLLTLFEVPPETLPEVVPSAGMHFGVINSIPALDGVPVTGAMADSHAALFAHGAFTPGPVKATYGTGSSVIGLIDGPVAVPAGVCLTIAWQLDKLAYAAEGNIQATGAALTWLAGLLQVTPSELVALGETSASLGVVLVPAFDGLGAPWWDDEAVGLLSGLSLATGRAQLARAALECVGAQVADVAREVLSAVHGDSRSVLFADGGVSTSDVVMQLQADMLGLPVERARNAELSALGAAHMAGVGAGCWDLERLSSWERGRDIFLPSGDSALQESLRGLWRLALRRARLRSERRADTAPPTQQR